MNESLKRAVRMIDKMLTKYREDIENTYLEPENEGGVAINLRITIAPGPGVSQKEVTTSLNFVQRRIKASLEAVVDRNQYDLPGIGG
jgi:hypothetical protein